jgi:hypothetical protein
MSNSLLSRIALLSAGSALLLGIGLHWRQGQDDARSLGDIVRSIVPDSAVSEESPGVVLILQPVDCRGNLEVVSALNALQLTT